MPASDRISVLVVEDHPETLDLMCEMLAAHGYDPMGVATAEEGLRELRSGRYAVVISDHWLDRGETGTWMLGTAAHEGLLAHTAAIMCSAERRIDGVPDGVPVLTKPIDFPKLLSAIERLLDGAPPPEAPAPAVVANDHARASATLYVTTTSASARARRRMEQWRSELERAGIDVDVVDLEREPARADADDDRVAATPVLVVHKEGTSARLVGALDETTVEDVLDLVRDE